MIKINPSKISGKLSAPASKAHAIRLLFMASMPAYPTCVKNVPRCDDVDVAISCLQSLGCDVIRNKANNEMVIKPFPKTSPLPEVDFNFKESATSAKIASALCATLGIKANCKAEGTLLKRKLSSYTERLALRGVTFSAFSLPFTQSGRMLSGDYELRGDEGSQSISALLMFLPCLLGDSSIQFEPKLLDDSFINITIDSLKQFKVNVEKSESTYTIPGRQYYQSPGEIVTENDWGLSSMWIAAAAAGGDSEGLTVSNLPLDSSQKYRNIKETLALIAQDFSEIEIDITDSPNLATLYCALAIVKGAAVHIKGAGQLKYKESNRFQTMIDIAKLFGQNAYLSQDGIDIVGNGKPVYPKEPIDCKGDPWIFMSMVLASAKASESFLLADEKGADKIYRDFLTHFESLGGKYEIISDQTVNQ